LRPEPAADFASTAPHEANVIGWNPEAAQIGETVQQLSNNAGTGSLGTAEDIRALETQVQVRIAVTELGQRRLARRMNIWG
jgi:hypothetical protein